MYGCRRENRRVTNPEHSVQVTTTSGWFKPWCMLTDQQSWTPQDPLADLVPTSLAGQTNAQRAEPQPRPKSSGRSRVADQCPVGGATTQTKPQWVEPRHRPTPSRRSRATDQHPLGGAASQTTAQWVEPHHRPTPSGWSRVTDQRPLGGATSQTTAQWAELHRRPKPSGWSRIADQRPEGGATTQTNAQWAEPHHRPTPSGRSRITDHCPVGGAASQTNAQWAELHRRPKPSGWSCFPPYLCFHLLLLTFREAFQAAGASTSAGQLLLIECGELNFMKNTWHCTLVCVWILLITAPHCE
ncbi:hypothetical protein P7K49_027794 [Saguinus oedipus]|uniref:Uncharacterized protein n=1 Tax=Saguinus oedipus TaxID=9490 RepID=A0ABQ9UAZ3_SAGOE|nr:hypothetical protein P7K49_027794 [Saguinus oedipus]